MPNDERRTYVRRSNAHMKGFFGKQIVFRRIEEIHFVFIWESVFCLPLTPLLVCLSTVPLMSLAVPVIHMQCRRLNLPICWWKLEKMLKLFGWMGAGAGLRRISCMKQVPTSIGSGRRMYKWKRDRERAGEWCRRRKCAAKLHVNRSNEIQIFSFLSIRTGKWFLFVAWHAEICFIIFVLLSVHRPSVH